MADAVVFTLACKKGHEIDLPADEAKLKYPLWGGWALTGCINRCLSRESRSVMTPMDDDVLDLLQQAMQHRNAIYYIAEPGSVIEQEANHLGEVLSHLHACLLQ